LLSEPGHGRCIETHANLIRVKHPEIEALALLGSACASERHRAAIVESMITATMVEAFPFRGVQLIGATPGSVRLRAALRAAVFEPRARGERSDRRRALAEYLASVSAQRQSLGLRKPLEGQPTAGLRRTRDYATAVEKWAGLTTSWSRWKATHVDAPPIAAADPLLRAAFDEWCRLSGKVEVITPDHARKIVQRPQALRPEAVSRLRRLLAQHGLEHVAT